jgi:hypothetical protein
LFELCRECAIQDDDRHLPQELCDGIVNRRHSRTRTGSDTHHYIAGCRGSRE